MTWIANSTPPRIAARRRTPEPTSQQPACSACGALQQAPLGPADNGVCAACDHHSPLPARRRLDLLLDPEPRRDLATELRPADLLGFRDLKPYPQRLARAAIQSSASEAMQVTTGALGGHPLVAACFEYSFMGGSMGSVVGERFIAGVDAALEQGAPLLCITASGGARMQEGLFSLMQMARTVAAVSRLRAAGLPFITLLTHPTMGGVSASFAFLADVVLAEPGALIGFAGPRVIRQTVGGQLPEGFQRAEYLRETGAVDRIVDRRGQRETLIRLLEILSHARPRRP